MNADGFLGQTMRQHEGKVLLVLTLVTGALVGLVVVAFILVTENLGARMYPPGAAAWRRVLIPVAGALVTGFLLQRYFPNARGSGIPQTKTALFIRDGIILFRTALGKFACSSISLASGIALGREGPSVQVGAGLASTLGRRVGLSPRRVRSLVPIGAAAALAAAFNTPIAAVLFTLEEVMGDLHAPVLGSIVLSSATSWMVLHLVLGDEPLFHVPAYQLVHPVEFAFYAVLGVVGGLVSVGFVKLLLWQRERFKLLPSRTQWLQPAVGGLLVGLMGWVVPEVLGVGYGYVSQALNGQMLMGMMALLVLLKVVATATCYASGNAGGIFGPSLFMGAMLGGAFGGAAHMLLPDYTGSVGAYALVGMGTLFAGVVRVPLTSVIMIFEVTRDYSIIVPLMISNLISYWISSRLQEVPIYEALQHQDGIRLPAGARDREELPIVQQGSHPPETTLTASETVEHAVARVTPAPQAWPVVDPGGLVGMVTRIQLEAAVREGRGWAAVGMLALPASPETPAEDGDFPYVYADDPLDTAMRRMARAGIDTLPVVSRTNLRELKGVISMADILAAYRLPPDEGEKAALPRRVLGLTIAAFAGVLLVAGFLSYFHRAERAARAQRDFQQANTLAGAGRYEEAIEKYRSAVSISHSGQHRLALALALASAGRLSEAEIYLGEFLKENPTSGPANLGLARIKAQQDDIPRAVMDYHRAIYGAWAQNPAGNRAQTRLELIGFLGKSGLKQQAQAELLTLRSELPADPAMRKRAAHLFLDFGLPKEAAEVFREVLKSNESDAEARGGLGEAELALDDFDAARKAFADAARRDPANKAYQDGLRLAEAVIAMDPARRGLPPAERYARSRKLVEATLGSLDQCLARQAGSPPDADRSLAETARKALLSRRAPHSYGDAAAANVDLAGQVWGVRLRLCGPPNPTDEPVRKAMEQVQR